MLNECGDCLGVSMKSQRVAQGPFVRSDPSGRSNRVVGFAFPECLTLNIAPEGTLLRITDPYIIQKGE